MATIYFMADLCAAMCCLRVATSQQLPCHNFCTRYAYEGASYRLYTGAAIVLNSGDYFFQLTTSNTVGGAATVRYSGE